MYCGRRSAWVLCVAIVTSLSGIAAFDGASAGVREQQVKGGGGSVDEWIRRSIILADMYMTEAIANAEKAGVASDQSLGPILVAIKNARSALRKFVKTRQVLWSPADSTQYEGCYDGSKPFVVTELQTKNMYVCNNAIEADWFQAEEAAQTFVHEAVHLTDPAASYDIKSNEALYANHIEILECNAATVELAVMIWSGRGLRTGSPYLEKCGIQLPTDIVSK